MQSKKILYIKAWDVSFIKKDEEILKKNFTCLSFLYRSTKGFTGLKDMIRCLFWLLKNIKNTDCIYVWFAGIHSLIPSIIARLFGKKLIIVLGGLDVETYPPLNYGFMLHPLTRFSVQLTCKLADLLLPVTEHTLRELKRNVKPIYSEKSQIIYNSYFGDIFKSENKFTKKNQVMTVCAAADITTVKRKAIDVFIDTARIMPETPFLVVGISGEAYDFLNNDLPTNVQLIKHLPFKDLARHYSESKVFCQVSRLETFGVAIIEAIACDCFPIVNNSGGMPEIINGTKGIILKELNNKELKEAIEEAFTRPQDDILDIKEKVLPRFDSSIREREIVNIISTLSY